MEKIDIQELDKKKRYLKRYKKNKALIERLTIKLEDINDRLYKVKSPNYSGMPRGGTPITTADILSDKKDLEDRIARLKIKGRTFKSEILDKIDELDDTRYAEILESFFIECKEFEDIAEEQGYTVRHVIRIYSEAINSMSLE